MNKVKKGWHLSKIFKIILTLSLIGIDFNLALLRVRSESTQQQEDNYSYHQDGTPENLEGGSSYAHNFDGDGKPKPGNRQGGASRTGGISPETCPPTNPPLIALVPETNLGLTVDEYPTFWFYVPYNSTATRQAEFMLLDENQHPVTEKIISVQLSGKPGIIGVKVPSTAKPIQLNQEYRWYFSVICDSENPSKNPSTYGWIKRVEVNAELNNYQGYVNKGIWFNALTEVAQSRQTNPSDAAIATEWQKLLQAIGLEELAETSVINCCATD